jgi:hypothetical protein
MSAASMVGIYKTRIDNGVDCIELQKNGLYEHLYIQGNGESSKQSGSWYLENLQAGQTLVLEGFEPLLGGKSNGSEIYLLLINARWGGVGLITNIDTGDGYKGAASCRFEKVTGGGNEITREPAAAQRNAAH